MTDVFRTEIFTPDAPKQTIMDAANQLPVTLLDFALLTGMKGRAYGVKTVRDDECWHQTWFTQCARDHVWALLLSVQQNLFASKKFTLRGTYIQEEILWKPGQHVKTSFPFVDKINVRQVFNSLGTVTVSPFIEEDVDLVITSGFIDASVDRTRVHNSKDVVFRLAATYVNAPVYFMKYPLMEHGYPYADVTDWHYPLNASEVLISDTIHAQDANYVFVEIDPIVNLTMDDIVFMHPSQDQVIRQALPPQLVGGKWRFWFYYWMLKRPEFAEEKSDLTLERDFDQFYSSIRYGTWDEETCLAQITYEKCVDCGNALEQPVRDALGEIVSGEPGVVRFFRVKEEDDGYVRACSDACEGLDPNAAYKVTLCYHVDPYQFGMYVGGIEELRRAIVAKVAANIPKEMCEIELNAGYIKQMQEELPDVIQVPLQNPVARFDYGHRRGDREFVHALRNLTLKKRVTHV